jgi:hypothetical protein
VKPSSEPETSRCLCAGISTIFGRAVRGLSGLLLILGAFLARHSRGIAIVLFLAGLFCIFEAFRGWCALRTCGMKTKIRYDRIRASQRCKKKSGWKNESAV